MYNKGSSKIDRVRRTPDRVRDPGRKYEGGGAQEIPTDMEKDFSDIQTTTIIFILKRSLEHLALLSVVLKSIIGDFEKGNPAELDKALEFKGMGAALGKELKSVGKLIESEYEKGVKKDE